jgi:hypothetical protein
VPLSDGRFLPFFAECNDRKKGDRKENNEQRGTRLGIPGPYQFFLESLCRTDTFKISNKKIKNEMTSFSATFAAFNIKTFKNLRASPFNDDLLIDIAFSQIHLA